MKYSPKLKKAKDEIMEILKKHDIAAVVALHTPGNGEVFYRLETGYSCVKVLGDGAIRIRTRIDKDYNGDKQKRDQAIGDTTNMFLVLEESLGPIMVSLMNVNDQVKKLIPNIEHGDSTFTSTSETDN